MTRKYGADVSGGKTQVAVRSPNAQALWLCLFDGDKESRIAMRREGDDWLAELAGDQSGAYYGYRAEGDWAPERGHWFDPAKLLVDPYALTLDRRFVQDPRLAEYGVDTAALVPRAIVPGCIAVAGAAAAGKRKPKFERGGLIYELNVRGFTMLHPDVPPHQRGTVAALAHPTVIAHFKTLNISAVELMPITAWIDERHLPPLGLCNAWGYNPVTLMALDPGLCPGGIAELRDTVAALHKAGIGVILDLVFNHTGESDVHGGVLSLRGLDNAVYAHGADGGLINDTGCGNTLDFSNPAVQRMTLDSLRHFVRHCGIDGFRFDLATIMARGGAQYGGFDPAAPIFAAIADDPLLADRIMIAEPWDIGPGGYQLGNFPPNWLEWNDRYRDDVRRFWQGSGTIGALVTRIAGSSDIFGDDCRSVNFLSAHDGFTLADTVSYAQRHNHANGEDNRDGHADNHSWNNGAEGPSEDPAIIAARAADLRALLAALFASTGTIMLTAGDEFGRSQHGNNNAYAQDNARYWIDWENRDGTAENYVAALARARKERRGGSAKFPPAGHWLKSGQTAMTDADWDDRVTDAVTYIAGEPHENAQLSIDRSRHVVTWDVTD